jgi:hypothetical protein
MVDAPEFRKGHSVLVAAPTVIHQTEAKSPQ